MKGLLITFEGGEGAGKSTQVVRLAERLRGAGRVVRLVREPGGTAIGEEIRHLLKHSPNNDGMTAATELLLMNASRAQLVGEVLRPALAAGEVVLCDRYSDSTLAYQGYGRGLPLDQVAAVVDFAVGDTRPNLTLLLEVPPAVSAARLAVRQASRPAVRDRIEAEAAEFFARVERGFTELAAREPRRIRRLDASGSEDEVAAAIWAEVAPLLETAP